MAMLTAKCVIKPLQRMKGLKPSLIPAKFKLRTKKKAVPAVVVSNYQLGSTIKTSFMDGFYVIHILHKMLENKTEKAENEFVRSKS